MKNATKLFLAFLLTTTLLGCTLPMKSEYVVSTLEIAEKITLVPIPTEILLGTEQLQILNGQPRILQPTAPIIIALTPTIEEEPNPYIFISNYGEADLSVGPISISFIEGALEGKKISANLISPENLGGYSSTSEGLKIGTGIGVIRAEDYGNVIISMHSAYIGGDINKPLEGEVLRFFIEKWGKSGDTYVQENLVKMVGTKGVLSTDGVTLDIEILGGVRLQNQEAEELRLNPTKVLDIVTKKKDGNYIALGNAQIFEKIKKDGHEILISFCGWGPQQQFTYYRYVILVEIKEKSETPEDIK